MNVLIDCGLFQGFKNLRLRNWDNLPIEASSINAVVLTHAHIDHSGYIPLLVKKGFRGKIYCTEATEDLCKILLPDSGYLQEEEARFANKRGHSKHKPALPLYTQQDAEESLKHFEPVRWQTVVSLSNKLAFKFFPAGHLLGAASVQIQHPEATVLFSGDVGRPHDPIMKEPAAPPPSDYMVIESTYGDRLHKPEDAKISIQNIVNRTIKRGGTVLIPSFAVGRAQTMLYYFHLLKKEGAIPDVPIFLNSPMAVNANFIFEKHNAEHRFSRQEFEEICSSAIYINSPEESQKLNERTDPSIIIAASGMATGGRILHHLKTYLPDPRHCILFVGFQAGGTRGEAMVRGVERVKIHGEHWPVRAEIKKIDSLSAHVDSNEILSWLQRCPSEPRRVFITHGEPHSAESLRVKLEKNLKWNCHIPYYLEKTSI